MHATEEELNIELSSSFGDWNLGSSRGRNSWGYRVLQRTVNSKKDQCTWGSHGKQSLTNRDAGICHLGEL